MAAPLGLVHRDVGAAEQLGHVDVARLRDDHADRRLHGQRYPDHLGRHRDEIGQLAGPAQRLGKGVVTVGQRGDENRELVAGQARHQLTTAREATDPGRQYPQQPVTGRVPEGVVDLLEVVHVEQ